MVMVVSFAARETRRTRRTRRRRGEEEKGSGSGRLEMSSRCPSSEVLRTNQGPEQIEDEGSGYDGGDGVFHGHSFPHAKR
jgi:hypothetical protein